MDRPLRHLLPLIILLLMAPLCLAQSSATVTGVVQDSTGAVIPGANLTLTNVQQNRPWTTQSNAVGAYTFQQIPPGNYRLEVEADGFKKFSRSGLIINVAQTAEINVPLEVGALTETVEITAETPLLDTASSTLGEVVNEITTENLPLNGRNVLQLVALTPGINTTRSYRTSSSGSGSISAVAFSANGGRNVSNQVMLDGTPQEVMGYNQPSFVPSPDAVQEFKVQTNALSAEYGRSGGAVVNMVHRSGTSEFHGVGYWFVRNDAFDANSFFQNRNKTPKSGFRYNQYGATLGGPMTPSRETTFFFVNYEGLIRRNAGGGTHTVPTAKMRSGDFSELLDPSLNKISEIIYDPMTIDGSGVRQPFAGNIIPGDRLDPVGVNFVNEYPTPSTPNTFNNFFTTKGNKIDRYTLTAKFDHRFSERNNFFGRINWDKNDSKLPDHYETPGSPNLGNSGARNKGITIDDTHMLGQWILHGNAGIAYHANPRDTPIVENINAQLGLPSYIDDVNQFRIHPRVNPTGYNQLGTNGSWIIGNKFYNIIFSGDASRLIGNHTVKFGGTYRLNRVSNFRPVDPNGQYAFNMNWTRQKFNGGSGGDGIATMLLGLPTGGQLRTEPSLSEQVKYGALYFQDDWRVNNKLTVNMGLRWETDRALTEKWDRASWYNTGIPLPLEVPGFGTFFGGIEFAGRHNQFGNSERGIVDLPYMNFSPRLGFAYKLSDRIVLRSGFGMFYNPTTGNGPNPTKAGALSFNSQTGIPSSIDGGRTPYATLQDPFPDGFIVPLNGSDGEMTNVGSGISTNFRDRYMPYSIQWNVNVQYELPGNMLLDAAYAGNSGVHLQANASQLNQLPDALLSEGDRLQEKVDNPFFGILPAASGMGKKTTTYGQLLRPYPHLTGLNNLLATHAHSSYHALQLKFRKRYSNGIQFLVAYTFSKTIDDLSSVAGFLGQENPGYTNHNNRRLDKGLSNLHVPHVLSVNYQWELPFGKGKPFLNSSRALDLVAGGWVLNGITTAQSGLPMSITSRTNTLRNFGGTQRPDYVLGQDMQTSGSNQERIDGWINPAAFQDTPEYTYGTLGMYNSALRGPDYMSWDLSILKNFQLTERFRLQFRSEFFNAFNRPNFNNPGGRTFGNNNFGVITGTEPARVIQFGLKLHY